MARRVGISIKNQDGLAIGLSLDMLDGGRFPRPTFRSVAGEYTRADSHPRYVILAARRSAALEQADTVARAGGKRTAAVRHVNVLPSANISRAS